MTRRSGLPRLVVGAGAALALTFALHALEETPGPLTPENANEARLNRIQPPEKVLAAIGLEPGMSVGEIGAGRGRYTVQIASRVGDVKRFPRGKSLAHYWGLTPGCRDSGETKGRRGHITKAGSAMARWLLAQVTFHVLRRDPVMRRWYKPSRNRRGSNIARIAVMRRLAVIIRNMLVHQQDYAECRDAMLRRHHQQKRQRSAA